MINALTRSTKSGKVFVSSSRASALAGPMGLVPQPGPVLVAIDLHLVADPAGKIAPERLAVIRDVCEAHGVTVVRSVLRFE